MSIAIITIGERDLQNICDNKAYEFKPRNKNNINIFVKRIEKLKEKMDSEELKYIPYIKNDITQENETFEDTCEDIFDEITFPGFEKTLNGLKKYIENYKCEPITKVYILYSDRQKFLNQEINPKLEKIIKKEPYFYAKIIEKFWNEIKRENELDFGEIRLINFVEDIDVKDIDINRNNMIEIIDKIIRNIKEENRFNNKSNVFVETTGGIPDIKNMIEEISINYFAEKTLIFDKSETKEVAEISKYHNYKLVSRYKQELLNAIESYNFNRGYELINVIRKYDGKFDNTGKGRDLVEVIDMYLNGGLVQSKNKIHDNLRKYDSGEKNVILWKLAKNINTRKNKILNCIMRSIVMYRNKNYWGMATVLMIALELSFIELLAEEYKDSIVEKENKTFIKIDKIFLENELEEIKKNLKIEENAIEKRNLAEANWKIFKKIYDENKIINHKILAQKIQEARSNFRSNRNEFMHEGIGIEESVINKTIGIYNKVDYSNNTIGSNLLKEIAVFAGGIENMVLNDFVRIIKKELELDN